MSDMKSQLIRLGYDQPELRDHLRPIIASLEKTASTYGELAEAASQVGVHLDFSYASANDSLADDVYEWFVSREGIPVSETYDLVDDVVAELTQHPDNPDLYLYDVEAVISWYSFLKGFLGMELSYLGSQQLARLAPRPTVRSLFGQNVQFREEDYGITGEQGDGPQIHLTDQINRQVADSESAYYAVRSTAQWTDQGLVMRFLVF